MIRTITAILLALSPLSASAYEADSCEDLSFRLYRADLAPGGVRFQEVQSDEFGDHLLAEVFVKNVGTVKLGPSSAPDGGFNVAPIRISIAGFVTEGYVSLPLAPGASQKVHVRLPLGAIQHCEVVDIWIDMTRTAKQKGCDCFDNDAAKKRAVELGEPSCRL